MKINEIIEECLLVGIPVKCEYIPNRGFVYEIEGFYKSDTISLELEDGKLIATARYDEKTEINSPKDVVELNHTWWNYSKDRYVGWNTPSDNWKKLFDLFELKY